MVGIASLPLFAAASPPALARELLPPTLVPPVVGLAVPLEPDAAPSPSPVPMVHRKRLGLAIGGGVTFGVSWGLTVITSILLVSSPCTDSCDNANAGTVFWIPLAGPVIGAIQSHTSQGRIVFGTWSVVEAVGFTMLVIGLVGHDVPDKRAARASREGSDGPALSLAPLFAPDTAGVTVLARW